MLFYWLSLILYTQVYTRWSAGHNFNFSIINRVINHQAKRIFKPNRISELHFLKNTAIHLNREIIVNEKIDSIILSTAWRNLFNDNYSNLNSSS